MRSAVASQAIMVPPDSPHNYPGTLGNQPVAVNFHAGSHYVGLRLLEGYLPVKKIKLVHYGSPIHRFESMLNGEVAAAVVMEPWIALGEKLGCKTVAEGHYLGAENASEDMDEETFAAINRAVENAVDLINADKKKYIHYMLDEMPDKYARQLDVDECIVKTDVPIERDVVLVGGGHVHVEVLRQFAMRPQFGTRLTPISREVNTPYSGMLPGFLAGHYSFDECHIDLAPLCQRVGAQLFHKE